MTGPDDRQPPFPHDTAPFTMPAETAERISAYGTQGGGPESTATPVLEARDISKYFGRVIALEHVSLSVRPGEVNCLLGDNGAGKSTLIKILSGVHRPDSGTMLMEGGPVAFHPPRNGPDRGVAPAYQDLAVLPLCSI